MCLGILGVLTMGCGGGAPDALAPPKTSDAADGLAPIGAARAASLITTIRSAGQPCAGVTKTFLQGPRNGGDVWNATCSDGPSYAIVSTPQDTTVMTCSNVERETGVACFVKF
jgi:hypothetical protein